MILTKSYLHTQVQSLWELCANLAWQEVACHKDRTDTVSLLRMLATAMDGVIDNYHLKTYAQQRLFQFFPEKNWPSDFIPHINAIKIKMPKATWLNNHPQLLRATVAEQQHVNWGHSIMLKAAGRKEIIG
jgi:hypothetical protein